MTLPAARPLLRRGLRLEYVTLGWNVVAIGVLGWSAVEAQSVSLAGFGLDSLIEIGASLVVVWELRAEAEDRRRAALRLIGVAFSLLAVYLAVQGSLALASGHRAAHSPVGIAWTGATAVAMFLLAWGKATTGKALDNPVLRTEGRVTLVDGVLAVFVLTGLVLNAIVGWWWADPAAGFILVAYAIREGWQIFVAKPGAATT